jgi:peptide methionine sulfoxide reductase MsrB
MAKKRNIKPFEVADFTNHLGHILKPGDPIISVTMCTSSAHVRAGKYLGYRKQRSYYSKDHVGVLVEVVESRKHFVHAETGAPYDHKGEYKEIPHPQQKYVPYKNTFGQPWHHRFERTPEEKTLQAQYDEEYKAAREEYKAKIAERQKGYVWVDVPYTRISNLQLNKVYPADMTFAALVGSRI